MYKKSKYTWLEHLDFLFVDMMTMLISFVVAYFLKFGDFGFIHSLEWLRLVLLFSLMDISITLIINPYNGIFRRSYYMEAVRGIQLTFYNLIAVALILYIFKIGEDYSRTVFIIMYLTYFVLSFITKYVWKKLIVNGIVHTYNTKPISLFIIGKRQSIITTLTNVCVGDFLAFDIKGLHFQDDKFSDKYKSFPVISDKYEEFIIKNNITDVLISLPTSELDQLVCKKLIDNGVNVHIDIETILGMQTEEQYIADVGILKTLSVGAFDFKSGDIIYLFIKRLFDIVFGCFGIMFLVPISLLVKISYLLSGDTANIFYTQKRIGLNGKPIKIYKYRTMVVDADKKLEELLKDDHNKKEWEANQKLKNDPRITKAGKILRKLSIDELPQLLNVIKGDMSIVGPRPLIEGELESHGGLKLYQKLKPGITGWWGCNGRSNIEYRERLELEYYYIKNFSIYLDVLCVFRTIFALLKKDGAE